MKDNHQRMLTQLSMLKDLGYKLDKNAVIVDLGCGNGELVHEFIKEGFDAYGCDFQFKEGDLVETLSAQNKIRLIDTSEYRLPFDDNSIDFLITDQVFEHVSDYPGTLAEMNRVLKPGGLSLNFFPSRYGIIEPHVFVPFASVLKKYNWLLLWAYLGIRKKSQRGLPPKAVAQDNLEYLKDRTFYLTKSQLTSHCNRYFSVVRFSEDVFIKQMQRARIFRNFSNVSLFPWLYSTLRHRVLFLSK